MNFNRLPKPANNREESIPHGTPLRGGAEEKGKAPISAVGGSLDVFLAGIEPVEPNPVGTGGMVEAAQATKGEVEIERSRENNRKAKEKIQPLIDKFGELLKEEWARADYVRGEKEFAVLSGDKERYSQLYNEAINRWLAQADLYEQALREYHEEGGEGELQGVGEMYTGSTRESVLIFEKSAMGGADTMFEKSKDQLAGNYDNKMSNTLPNDVRATTPNQFISNLELNAVAEAGRKEQFVNNPENRKDDVRGYFGRRAQGFGIGALNYGDVVVAARSLALAEAVGEIPADVQEQIRTSYYKLNESKRVEFVDALKKERGAFKQRLDQAFASAQDLSLG